MSLEQQLPFRDRRQAGRLLASELAHWRDAPGLVVLALPRGGVPVGFEVARALHAPLDVFVVRKVGMPGQSEFAVGAIASGGVRVMDPLSSRMVSEPQLESIVQQETEELARREQLYRAGQPPLELHGRTVLVIDDGIATGATMEAAVTALRQRQPLRLVVATPVASVEAAQRLEPRADQLVCGATPRHFHAVSLWYDHFPQTSDEEVQELLERSRRGQDAALQS